MQNNEKEIKQYENDVFETLKNKIENLKKKEINNLIISKLKEIDNKKFNIFYPEDYHSHYAKERIKNKLKEYIDEKNNNEKILKKSDKKGFGGWLIFFIIGIIYQPFGILINMAKYSQTFNSLNELFWVQLLFSFFIIYLLFKKKKEFVKWVINYIIILNIINFSFMSYWEVTPNQAISFFLVNIPTIVIWILYFTKSQRVKNTFVN